MKKYLICAIFIFCFIEHSYSRTNLVGLNMGYSTIQDSRTSSKGFNFSISGNFLSQGSKYFAFGLAASYMKLNLENELIIRANRRGFAKDVLSIITFGPVARLQERLNEEKSFYPFFELGYLYCKVRENVTISSSSSRLTAQASENTAAFSISIGLSYFDSNNKKAGRIEFFPKYTVIALDYDTIKVLTINVGISVDPFRR